MLSPPTRGLSTLDSRVYTVGKVRRPFTPSRTLFAQSSHRIHSYSHTIRTRVSLTCLATGAVLHLYGSYRLPNMAAADLFGDGRGTAFVDAADDVSEHARHHII